MTTTETSNPRKEVVKRAREETSEGANGGGGASDGTSKKDVGAGGEGGAGISAEKKVEAVSWESLKRPMTSRGLYQHFDFLMHHVRLDSPFSHEWARGILDLVKNGHPDPEKMIGCGVESCQVRLDEMCTIGRTFFLVRKDGSTADFCFRTCINNILPLPDNMKDHGGGVVAICACHLPGGMKALEAVRIREAQRPALPVKYTEVAVTLGPMKFRDARNMFQYFFAVLLNSPLNEAISGDYHLVLLELLKNGCPESEEKIGSGVESFQVRIHPRGLRCFYLIRGDGSVEDFCYIKCIDNILPSTELFTEKSACPCSYHHEEDGEGCVTLGWHKFHTSTEMVLYFNKFMRDWSLNTRISSEMHNMLLDLLKKGDPNWWREKKSGSGSGSGSDGVQSFQFQIRECPTTWNKRSYFIVWENGSTEPFCFMTCIDNLPLLPKRANAGRGGGKRARGGGRKGGAGRGTRRGGRG